MICSLYTPYAIYSRMVAYALVWEKDAATTGELQLAKAETEAGQGLMRQLRLASELCVPTVGIV